MAGFTLAQAEELLLLYIAAEKAILTGQAYTILDRSLTRADLKEVRAERKELSSLVEQLTGMSNVARKIKVYGGTPV